MKDVALYTLAIGVSLVGHVFAIEVLANAARHKPPRKVLRPMEIAMVRPPPKAEPPPPPPAPKKPKRQKRPKQVVKPPLPEAPPPPNTAESLPEPTPTPRPMFGVTLSSVIAPGRGSGFSVRVGNTLMTKPKPEASQPTQVVPYSAPAYKLSRLPRRRGDCEAIYPEAARTSGIQGKVRLKVEVLADGSVGQVQVVRGLGYGLDEAAAAALKRCQFSPGVMRGKKVATLIHYTYSFVIEG